MEKKRRDFINCELINLLKEEKGFKDIIAFSSLSENEFDYEYSKNIIIHPNFYVNILDQNHKKNHNQHHN